MSGYDQSRWADSRFSGNYARQADNIIMGRRTMIGVLVSYYGQFLSGEPSVRVLDLGCGDGTLTLELADKFGNVVPTLVDGSPDMLDRADSLLGGIKGATFVQASFQELLAGSKTLGEFDLAFSSLAIHHLEGQEKVALFKYLAGHLRPGGHFVNIDVVLPPTETLEEWYLETWQSWVDERGASLADDPEGTDIAARYKANTDNVPDTLEFQVKALRDAGFTDVDCFYKDGIFAVFGGRIKR